jgi:hypothetical protein
MMVLNAMIINIKHKIRVISRSIEIKSIERNGLKTRIYLIECGYNHSLVIRKNGIRL